MRGSALILAIAALVVLPPLLCATPHQSCSPRLGRGLEEPPAKRSSTMATAAHIGPVFSPGVVQSISAPAPEPVQSIVLEVEDRIPNIALDRSFDTRRGPPPATS